MSTFVVALNVKNGFYGNKLMVFTLSVSMRQQRSKESANPDVMCRQGFINEIGQGTHLTESSK